MPDYNHYLGTVLNGSYRLDSLVRIGGMGAVFRASHTRLPRTFAIKVLPLDSQANPELVIRFQREAEITATLHHPHIVEVTDYNVAEIGVPYLVMELLQGVDLRRHLAKHSPVALSFIRTVLEQATPALETAHEAGIVHRDLKPSNLFLCKRAKGFHLKVLDFGVSKIVGAQSDVTSTQASIGTPRYMAPEQARGKAAEVDARTDVFALSTMTYEMLTGRSPFAADSIPSMLYRIVHEDPDDLGQVRPDLPTSLVRAVHRGMAKRKDERYPSMHDLWQAFDVALVEAIDGGADAARHGDTVIMSPDDSGSSRTGPPTIPPQPGRQRWPTPGTGPARPPWPAVPEDALGATRTGPQQPLQLSPTMGEVSGAGQTGPHPEGTGEITAPRHDPHNEATASIVDFSPTTVAPTGGPELETAILDGQPTAIASSAGVTGPPIMPGPGAWSPGTTGPPVPGSAAWAPGSTGPPLAPGPLTPPPAAFSDPPSLTDAGLQGSRQTKVIVLSALATIVVAAIVFAVVLATKSNGPTPGTARGSASSGSAVGASTDAGTTPARRGDAATKVARADRGAPTRATTRLLSVVSRPAGAAVVLGKKRLGTTPLAKRAISVAAGRLTLRLPGYHARRLELPAGSKNLTLKTTLRRRAPRKGTLRVMTTAAGQTLWANISIDGSARGQSPVVLRVPAGRYKVKANRTGYSSAQKTVTVGAGRQVSVVLRLRKR